jgi:hypothetical protein
MTTEYIIISDNYIDGSNVNYCDSEAELAGALRSLDGNHFSFPINNIEVFEVTRELTPQELLDIRGAT